MLAKMLGLAIAAVSLVFFGLVLIGAISRYEDDALPIGFEGTRSQIKAARYECFELQPRLEKPPAIEMEE